MTKDIREHSIMIANLAYNEGREFGSKTRPAFVLKFDDQIISYFNITSQYSSKSEYYQSKYFEIKDWAYSGLDKPSWIDTFKIRQVEEEYVVINFVSYLSAKDEARFMDFLANIK
ncbi:hypothetical protein [Pseudolactococcus reticulitermitis]|uniref:Type II toxin-antitoxin system PemK/MazF family toxin n=1 Tax=Pseudolactococcus reticulitermitis TaxID=2025039 RepID=A0A224X0R5_9LACT|nr:hypothetical protein [Lactococcus reticulitermitis]GAX46536.1 hypothetical protein RsY01_115 [Lactococcus reticulitermitis]